MPIRKEVRRHVAVRHELNERVSIRLALARALAQRTRMMIAKLDERLEASREVATRRRSATRVA